MAWDGYLTYDGEEIINVARTEAYAEAAGAWWLRPVFKAPHLAAMLDHEPYETPALDDAPWYDPNIPESGDFYGVYPLNLSGLDNSSRTSTVTENTVEGGSPGRIRHATKTFVASVVLLGGNEKAVEYGAMWLRRALLPNRCDPTAHDYGTGANLTFLSAEPLPTDSATPEGLKPYRRTVHEFVFNSGPTVTTKQTIESCGGEAWTISFTGVAGNPFIYGDPVGILDGYLDPGTVNPWVSGAVAGVADTTSIEHEEVECGDDTWAPIYDPLCPALIAPPAPPSLPLGCFTVPETWDRWKVTIPAENIPLWSAMVPVISLYTEEELRNVRIRFYEDATGTLDPEATPCAFVSEVVAGYIPAGGVMTIDGQREEVWVETTEGSFRRADSLAFTTEGRPIVWPVLACGQEQIMTVDVEAGSTPPVLSLSLVTRVV